MKKSVLFLLVSIFSFVLFGLNVNSGSALVPGCSGTSGFSVTTGNICDGSSRFPSVYLPDCLPLDDWACDGTQLP